MIRSMTGFARSTFTAGDQQITVEVSSVNHRFLEMNFRLPPQWPMLEPVLREVVKRQVARGKVYVSFRYARGTGAAGTLMLDESAVSAYLNAARHLARMMNSTEALNLNTLITLNGVIVPAEADEDPERLERLASEKLLETLTLLNAMREKEGAALSQALREHLAILSRLTADIRMRGPELRTAYEARLRSRLAELNAEVGLKEERLAMELILMAERMDVTEELVRLEAHLAHGRDLLASSDPIGRELNFLAQEMLREVNTLGSKLRDIETGRDVIEMKSELEMFREQVQNLE